MYKKQLVFQKFACLFSVIAAAVSFVYSLGLMTDIYDSLYSTMRNPNNLLDTPVSGSIIYYDMQAFNKTLLYLSIGLILLGCLLFITNTHIRRKYYVGNYVATGLYAAATVGVTVWTHIQVEAFKAQYLTTVDFEALREYADMWKSYYTDSTFFFDLHYLVAGLGLLAAIGLVGNMIWKITLMRDENSLLKAGKGAAV